MGTNEKTKRENIFIFQGIYHGRGKTPLRSVLVFLLVVNLTTTNNGDSNVQKYMNLWLWIVRLYVIGNLYTGNITKFRKYTVMLNRSYLWSFFYLKLKKETQKT